MSPQGSARHKGARWGGPRPSQPLATMFANSGGHFLRGRRRGGRWGSHTPSPAVGPALPYSLPYGRGAAPMALLAAWAAEPGERGGMSPLNAHHAGLTALKSGCHFPSGQPFTSIRRALLGSRRIQPRQTLHLTLRIPTAPPEDAGLRATRWARGCATTTGTSMGWGTPAGRHPWKRCFRVTPKPSSYPPRDALGPPPPLPADPTTTRSPHPLPTAPPVGHPPRSIPWPR